MEGGNEEREREREREMQLLGFRNEFSFSHLVSHPHLVTNGSSPFQLK
jgi:hypothetical protein